MRDRTLVLPADDISSIVLAARWLQDGRAIALPTDTVYGLAAHAFLPRGIRALFRIKGRDPQKAIPILLARIDQVTDVAIDVPEVAWKLARRFWPGPITIVLPKATHISDKLTGGAPSVALRVPDHPLTARLVDALGAPLAATSANPSGQVEATTAEGVRAALGNRVGLILDGGPCRVRVPSTVVDCTARSPLILRRGALVAQVEAFLAELQ